MRVWPVLVAAPLLLGAAVSDAAPRTRGKYVRVERTRTATSIPRVCEVRDASGGVCFGPAPMIGDIVTLLSEQRVIAEIRVTDSQEYATRGAACPGLYNIKVELMRGDFDPDESTIGIVDRDLDPRAARKVTRAEHPASPSGRPNESVQIAVDREGDGVADILVVQSDCDGQGQLCLDEWARVDRKMVRVVQTNFSNCGI
jgi:hypothetical protein